MHLQQSTIDDNIRAIEDLHRQAGYQAADLYNYVQLVHGDLGAFEKLESAREHCAAEEIPGLRMQYLIHIPGLFHVWMAGLEGLYRAWFSPLAHLHPEKEKENRKKTNHTGVKHTDALRWLTLLCPKEKGKFSSSSMPDLHRLESSLTHTSWGLVLDCWHLAVKAKDPRWETLADWVKSKPKWEDIVAISHEMVEQFLPGPAFDRERLTANADQVNANSKLYLRDLMDCTIFKAAVSSGDIGRVEQVLYSWVPMWKSTGKHKYARMISNFLYRLRFEYPKPLSHAIRMNWVFCPTGKNGQYRAVDWGVEEINLHTKVLWGGAGGPSRTWNLIYKHSILVGTFRKAMKSLERNFYIKSTAVLHPPPKIETHVTPPRKERANVGHNRSTHTHTLAPYHSPTNRSNPHHGRTSKFGPRRDIRQSPDADTSNAQQLVEPQRHTALSPQPSRRSNGDRHPLA
ncbi:uncharacterized protein EI90DRAFT_3174513 [Cantharellus anzutake]|uniref:uncharacterized protein n=1 Tax=Cantharellus anzutake TaxID=1750568 RepID=UPI00190823AD|nr:uncharacterized protein EI90DRAFT_3174513 [Cantharellus anzutake]KAF8335441.1 hypothetical protein EI90DRAFT_3174513 [Cantharellus anzutake]